MIRVEELFRQLEKASARIVALETENAALRRENEQLRRKVEQLESSGKVAPFRREPRRRKPENKSPGRPRGHPPAGRLDPEGPYDEEHEATLPCSCPACGSSKFGELEAVDEFVEELPEPKPYVTRIRSWRTTCRRCGKQIISPHPFSPTKGRPGAVRTRLGPRARATGAALTRTGMTVRKAAAVLRETAGLHVSPGGIVHSNHRLADSLLPLYNQLLGEVRTAPATHADETGWWMHGEPRTLCVFCSESASYFLVTPTRNRDLVRTTLGRGFNGVLVSDCLSIYDKVNPVQQKCYAHHLRAIAKALEQTPHAPLLKDLRELLLNAMALGRKKRRGKVWHQKRTALEREAGILLHQTRASPAERKVRNRLRKQRDHLFTFLDHPGVDATNNLAERQLRPAVITRKLSAGNKTERGARTWAILTSITATAQQRGQNPISVLCQQEFP